MSLDESRGRSTMPAADEPTDPGRSASEAATATRADAVPAPPAPDRPAPKGLVGQVGATRGAVIRLIKAHAAMAKAEAGEILGEVKRLAIGAGIALALLLFAGFLVPIGGLLFLGEWLFGSLGWGVLLGAELCVAFAVVAIFGVLGATRGQGATSFLIALVVGIVIGIVLGLDFTNQGWTRVGDSVNSGIELGVRPLVTAVEILGAVIAVVGVLAGLRAGGLGGGIGGAIGGAILGALFGAFTALRWGPQAGTAVGVAIGLILWPALLVASVLRGGLDFGAIKDRLLPNETIETTRETIEWVRKQTPLGRKS